MAANVGCSLIFLLRTGGPAEPLDTLRFRGTPVENYCSRDRPKLFVTTGYLGCTPATYMTTSQGVFEAEVAMCWMPFCHATNSVLS